MNDIIFAQGLGKQSFYRKCKVINKTLFFAKKRNLKD